MTENTNRVAIVTGGSRGIGRETAARLGKDHFDVVVVLRGATRPRPTRPSRRSSRPVAARSRSRPTWPTRPRSAALFDAAEQEFGGVDVVVHAAGIMKLSPLADLDLDDPRPDAPHQRPRHLRGRPAGRPPGARRRRDHQLLQLA